MEKASPARSSSPYPPAPSREILASVPLPWAAAPASSCLAVAVFHDAHTSLVFKKPFQRNRISVKLAGTMGHIKKGELTQEEKELLEVIGKGTGAGLVSGRCTPGRRALRNLERASGPEDLGQLAIRKKKKSLSVSVWGQIAGAGRWRQSIAIRSRLPTF